MAYQQAPNYGYSQQRPYSNYPPPPNNPNYYQQAPPPQSQQQYGSSSAYYGQPAPNYNYNGSDGYNNQYPPTKPSRSENFNSGRSYNNVAPPVKPPHSQTGTVKFNNAPEYKDLWATVLFLLTFAGYIVCLVIGVPKVQELKNDTNNNPGNSTGNNTTSISTSDLAILLGGSAAGGFILSAIYTFLIYKFAGKMIVASMVVNVLLFAGITVLLVIAKSWIAAIILGVLTLLMAWFYYSARHRIPFAKVLLKTVTSIMGKYPATVFVGFMGMIVQMALAVSWFIAIVGMSVHMNNSKTSNGAMYAAIVFIIFSFYWTVQVIKNVVHVTVSGVFATYFFVGVSAGGEVSVSVDNPTMSSAKRAMTTSFGPICFGSLVIAIIETIKTAMHSAANEASSDGNLVGAFCAICATCLLGCIKDLLEYFNMYAFTQVAIYGKGYCDAAKATWNLVKSKGIDAIINDSLVGAVLSSGSFGLGLLGAAYGCVVVYVSKTIPDDTQYYVIAALLCFCVVAVQFASVAEVIQSGVATTFVCLAEDPYALQRTKPELFEKIRQTYPQVAF